MEPTVIEPNDNKTCVPPPEAAPEHPQVEDVKTDTDVTQQNKSPPRYSRSRSLTPQHSRSRSPTRSRTPPRNDQTAPEVAASALLSSSSSQRRDYSTGKRQPDGLVPKGRILPRGRSPASRSPSKRSPSPSSSIPKSKKHKKSCKLHAHPKKRKSVLAKLWNETEDMHAHQLATITKQKERVKPKPVKLPHKKQVRKVSTKTPKVSNDVKRTEKKDDVKKQKVGDDLKRKHRFHSGTVALRQIRKLQKSTKPIIPYRPFLRLLRSVIAEKDSNMRLKKSALLAVRGMAEQYLGTRFRAAQLLAIHNGRVGVTGADYKLAEQFRFESELTGVF